ncbi:MAG: hypothetical protein EOO24_39880, partial [Comamonadaceae bacterium]
MTTDADDTLPFRVSLSLACPHCGTSVQATLPRIVDLAAEPGLRPALVQGTLHQVACPGCDAMLQVDLPVVVWNPVGPALL